MGDGLLRIGELAERAGVSTRTVDFYTGLGLLAPARRTGGNFRLYAPADVNRIRVIRRLEAQGIRLEDITRALTTPTEADGTPGGVPADRDRSGADGRGGAAGSAEPLVSLEQLEEQVRVLRELAAKADPRTRGVLATLTVRAQALITTAVILGGELIGEIEFLPPL
jgi:MerR family copper efflux transcriptional regulator